MPELPEVETIKRVLGPQIGGLTIESVTVIRSEVIAHPAPAEFCEALAGQEILGMKRRGKFLQIPLGNGDVVILHLRMTGCLLITPADWPKEKHTHVIFALSDGRELRFSDMRRFGRFWLLRSGEADTYTGIDRLGLEPFDKRLTPEYLQQKLGRRKMSIKGCLLDQNVISGIGNIYADEILFTAKLRPDRPANGLTAAEWVRLCIAIPERLAYFIEKNAISPEDYLQRRGQSYRNTPFLQVYGHGGKPCPICGRALLKTVIAGRSSVFCPFCQSGKI